MVTEADTKNYICTTSVGGGDNDVGAAELKQMGFVTQHAYSLNNVASVVSSYGQETTIV